MTPAPVNLREEIRMQKSKRKGLLSLATCIAGVWLITGYILPFVTDSFKTTRTLDDFIDESGIETGQFYYTGVESTSQAEAGARASIAFREMRRLLEEEQNMTVDK